jgi:hypothetical protein
MQKLEDKNQQAHEYKIILRTTRGPENFKKKGS